MKRRAWDAADGMGLLCRMAGAAACAVSLFYLFRAAAPKGGQAGGAQRDAEAEKRQAGTQAGAEAEQAGLAGGREPDAATKEEMIAQIHEMEPVLLRDGINVWLGKRDKGDYSWGYFFNSEIGMWEVFHVEERNDYGVWYQTGSEMQALKYLYDMLTVEYQMSLRHQERERRVKAERAAGLRKFHEPRER